jgi:regulatory protein
MKITSVEPQKKNSKRFNVYLDGNFAFGADEDLIVNYRLIPGTEVDAPTLEKLLFEAEIGKLMERMYGLFNVRQRSEREVRDYLRNLSFKRQVVGKEELSEMVVELLIERLKQKYLLNDEAFAIAWVEARQRSKQKGVKALKAELAQKGIDRETIDELVEGYRLASRSGVQGTGYSQNQVAEGLLTRRLPRLRSLPDIEQRRKATEFLMRRGFEYQVVKEVVAKLLKKEYTSL